MTVSEKNCTFDLFCSTDTGEQFIIEMQFSDQKHFKDRMLYYSTYPIRSQLVERLKKLDWEEPAEELRKKMNYRLDPVHVIGILNFSLEHESEETLEEGLICRYDLRSERSGEMMTDALHFIFLELERFPWTIEEETKCRTRLEQLVYCLKYGHLLQECPATFKDDKLFDLLFKATELANMDEQQLENYNATMTTKLDIIAQQVFAEEKGRQEEREKYEKELLESARSMLADGLPIEAIGKYTKLTVEQITALQ